MTTIKKKEDAVEEAREETVEDTATQIGFYERYNNLGAYVREQAPKVLKFDSNVSNIDYDYVDTQQYKSFIGACADACGISFVWSMGYPNLRIEKNDSGKQIFIVTVEGMARFLDKDSDEFIEIGTCGMGCSYGNNYALSIAQTNAMRNFLTNNFLIPTNDRDTDDMKAAVSDKASKFLTEGQKSEKRSQLLDKTKSTSEYATLTYAKVVYDRIQATLAKEDVPEDFRARLTGFMESKFDGDKPKSPEGMDDVWCVKKKAANAIMSDLDEYND